MKLRTLVKLTVASAFALTLCNVANAQTAANYKPEYRMSLVVGPAFPWGKGGQIWADLVKE